MKHSPYLPMLGTIVGLEELSSTEKLFRIELQNGQELDHLPGQFVEVSLFPIGEAPISISSSPTQRGYFELVIRKVGQLTEALHQLPLGSQIGIRGPLGNGFPLDRLSGKDLLFVAGGIGIIPLRSMINYVKDRRRDFGRVVVLLGCKTPQDLLFAKEYEQWVERADIMFSCTVDRSAPDWKGNVGLITSLVPEADIDPGKTFSLVVGPPIMYRSVIQELLKKGIPSNHIYVSLERRMKCGLGKCGHCQIGGIYSCKSGPVFRYSDIMNIEEAL